MSRFSLSRQVSQGRVGARIGGPPRATRGGRPPAVRAVMLGGLAVVALLTFAWIDGGEEPIHPIVVPVELVPAAPGETAR